MRGPISADALGITMCHVHVLSELKVAEQAKPPATMTEAELALLHHPVTTEMLGTIRRHANDACAIDNNLLGDIDLAIIELNAYRKMGGSSIVETSVVGLKRDPAGLRRISDATGVNIICGTGWYIGGSHPPVTRQSSIEQLSGIMVRELTAGIEDTGIRAGFIKAGLSGPTPDVPFQGAEEKVLRAGARAQAATGATMTMHPCHHYGRARHLHTYLDRHRSQARWASDLGHAAPRSRDARLTIRHLDAQSWTQRAPLAPRSIQCGFPGLVCARISERTISGWADRQA